MTELEIEHFLTQSGLTEPSLQRLRPHFPRWSRHLQEMGVTSIPSLYSTDSTDVLAMNELSLLARQAMDDRDAATEHNLRNLTGTRPYKP
jgi:hypothetical protein